MDKESSKLEEVRNWHIQKTVLDVLAWFLGLAGFYRKFVHGKFTEIARPLRLTDILPVKSQPLMKRT